MKKLIPAAICFALFGTLAYFGLTNQDPAQKNRQSTIWSLFCREVDEPQNLRDPRLQKQIAEINRSIPLVTIQTWDARNMKAASDYWQKVLNN